MPNIINFKSYEKIINIKDYKVVAVKLNSMYFNTPQNRQRMIFVGLQNHFHIGGLKRKLQTKNNKIPTTVKDYFGDLIDVEKYYIEPFHRGNKSIWSVYEPHPTIRGSGYRPSIITGIRCLTIRERLKIQSFPDSYQLINYNVKNANQAIGNSVPVNLGKHIANCLHDKLN